MKTPQRHLLDHIGARSWWHVPPADPEAYEKRGQFFASSFAEAEFWGRPLDEPQRVSVTRPLVGDEGTVTRRLFGKPVRLPDEAGIEARWKLDAEMKSVALAKGYDAIVIFSEVGYKRYKSSGRIPRSMELNLLTTSAAKAAFQ